MSIVTSYPGVYIQEVPSGVHTVTGVSTSITAFVGYTLQGPVNKAVNIKSFADFERKFGGLFVESPLSYSVKLFFQNGGSEAYVVRVAHESASASVTLQNDNHADVIVVTAASPGTWGNSLQIDVDYATTNPASLFNLTATSFVSRNGQLVPDQVETFRNLSMYENDPAYAVGTINAGSKIISVALPDPPPTITTQRGTSESGAFTASDTVTIGATHNRLAFTLDGKGPYEIVLADNPGTDPNFLDAIAGDIVSKINIVVPAGSVSQPTTSTSTITIQSEDTSPASSIHFMNASVNDAAQRLKLGLANGGTETDAIAAFRPEQTGTYGTATLPTTAAGGIKINFLRGSTTAIPPKDLPIWGPPTTVPQPLTLTDLTAKLNAALTAAARTETFLAGATAQRIGNAIRILPGTADPNISFGIENISMTDTTADTLGLTTGGTRNVARYAPGSGLTQQFQTQGTPGKDGTTPLSNELTGKPGDKSGIYALEDVDLFNLLVMPDASANDGMQSVLTEAIAYCVKRRAFMIVDVFENQDAFDKVAAWITGDDASSLRSPNSALYFPRMQMPDPLLNNRVRKFPAAGALAGLFARTDASRGVWKAPAGTSATIQGATGLSYTLTDGENGTLNPLGLNCLRTFPVYGTVSWGARTGRGADLMADDYKYIPVRRLALYLEESLYRGTKWVVFEPNDEPLWAQIRLNLGAFMHGLFAQGAFQGRTPREAYYVKCDSETTTQNDIDLGRVNIVVGYAPLKPAEFVIIQIRQIAGDIQT
ncbi:MAG TPA: phage tail sheath C-terminal domain-containing protein [Thermomicrobiaceae bacterium]|nr:phage tail sheath C-terminal domain-containing protein [Thermomicrobiaceae bacterium]